MTASSIALELPLMCLSREVLNATLMQSLEQITMSKIKAWRNEQFTENQIGMRAKFLKKCP